MLPWKRIWITKTLSTALALLYKLLLLISHRQSTRPQTYFQWQCQIKVSILKYPLSAREPKTVVGSSRGIICVNFSDRQTTSWIYKNINKYKPDTWFNDQTISVRIQILLILSTLESHLNGYREKFIKCKQNIVFIMTEAINMQLTLERKLYTVDILSTKYYINFSNLLTHYSTAGLVCNSR